MDLSRRILCQALPFLFTSAAWAANNQPIQSFIKPFDQLPVHSNPTSTGRSIINGATHAGYPLEVHETTLALGQMPHLPHQHEHEEMFLTRLAVSIAPRVHTELMI